jgi:hypothetical protein
MEEHRAQKLGQPHKLVRSSPLGKTDGNDCNTYGIYLQVGVFGLPVYINTIYM